MTEKVSYNEDNSRKLIEVSYSLLSFNIGSWYDILSIFFFKRRDYWASSRLGSNERYKQLQDLTKKEQQLLVNEIYAI